MLFFSWEPGGTISSMLSVMIFASHISVSKEVCAFENLPIEIELGAASSSSTISREGCSKGVQEATANPKKLSLACDSEMTLLDMYGGMSTGLCMGVAASYDLTTFADYMFEIDTFQTMHGLDGRQETVNVICGSCPPCQGISGFNRFRKKDEKNFHLERPYGYDRVNVDKYVSIIEAKMTDEDPTRREIFKRLPGEEPPKRPGKFRKENEWGLWRGSRLMKFSTSSFPSTHEIFHVNKAVNAENEKTKRNKKQTGKHHHMPTS
ncbi:hypothetical protein MKX03_017933 [Papaver bracteatum]|nr:hypothetical protein MKX03_017933 [Papaver bracteatum]